MSKILVVDDNSDICTLLRLTFEGAGHDVVSTQDPLKAAQLAELHQPEAVVLDVMMPRLSGWDVLREIRQESKTQAIPIVLLTALADVTDRIRGLRDGADDYQIKPFDPEELLARVEGLIARRGVQAKASSVDRPAVPEDVSEDSAPTLETTLAELERRLVSGRGVEDLCLGRYEVRKLLGRGAMGTVLDGWDPKLKRRVALKTLRYSPEALHGQQRRRQVARLLREAVANARINHPNIVTVYDVGDEGTAAFIAMELVEGPSLDDRLEHDGRLGAELVIPLAAAMARALAAAHRHEIVHRDIKPANVLLGEDGTIKVTDFGIAEFFSRVNDSGAIFGTPGYLAPETLTGDAATEASDLFSLGVTLYECLTGRNPFAEKNWRRTLHNTITKELRPLDEIVPGLPPRAAAMVSLLLEKEPSERPRSAAAVAELFDQMASSQDLIWKPGAAERGRRRLRLSTTRSRLVTLDTLCKTLDLNAAGA